MNAAHSGQRRLRIERLERRDVLAALPAVVGAHLIYNNSSFDGNSPAANAADDAAIATDKSPLQPGGAPAFANYSSYEKGINGVVLDVANLGAPVTQAAFTFRVGATHSPHTWTPAPAPTNFAVRIGAGASGSDRATFTWADNAIKNTWLQIVLNATGETIYYGNAVGETGNAANNAFVSAADELGVRTHFGDANVTSAYDFNRDGTVNAVDENIVRTNRRLFSTSLPMIATPKVTLTLESDSPTIGLAGEVIHYRYVVENAGAGAGSGVTVAGSGGIAGGTAPTRQADLTGDNDALLEPGEQWLYTSTATVTAAVLTAGTEVVRTATVDTDQTDLLKAVTGSTVAAATGDVFGGVTIRPIAHASFLITFRGKAIYVDPDGPASQYTGLPRADYIIITHEHGDHYDQSAIGAIANTNTTDAIPDTKFIVPQHLYDNESLFPPAARPLTTVLDHLPATATPATAMFLDDMMATLFSIQAVPAYNARHAPDIGNGYIVTIDSKRIYISGDTGAQPELRDLENIDIAFVAMNTPFTMTPAEAASLVGDMEPDVVYPYHYRNQDGTLGNSIAFKNLMSGNFDIEVRLRDWY